MNVVQFGGFTMNNNATSKLEILKVAKDITNELGIEAINMRLLASRCNVSLGTLYNYFPSKAELTIAVIDSIWKDIICSSHSFVMKESFLENVEGFYRILKSGEESYPSFIDLSTLTLPKNKASSIQNEMSRYFDHIKYGLLRSLENDNNVNQQVFNGSMSKVSFIEFVFSNVILCVVEKKDNCKLFLELIKRVIYLNC